MKHFCFGQFSSFLFADYKNNISGWCICHWIVEFFLNIKHKLLKWILCQKKLEVENWNKNIMVRRYAQIDAIFMIKLQFFRIFSSDPSFPKRSNKQNASYLNGFWAWRSTNGVTYLMLQIVAFLLVLHHLRLKASNESRLIMLRLFVCVQTASVESCILLQSFA